MTLFGVGCCLVFEVCRVKFVDCCLSYVVCLCFVV